MVCRVAPKDTSAESPRLAGSVSLGVSEFEFVNERARTDDRLTQRLGTGHVDARFRHQPGGRERRSGTRHFEPTIGRIAEDTSECPGLSIHHDARRQRLFGLGEVVEPLLEARLEQMRRYGADNRPLFGDQLRGSRSQGFPMPNR
jgi:hypothetical protein